MKHLYKIIFLLLLIASVSNLNAKSSSSDLILENDLEKGTTNHVADNLVLPSATITGSTTVCQNDTQPQITFTGSGGTAPYTFTYKIGTGSNISVISTGTGDTAIVNVPTTTTGVFVYTLVSVTDSSGTQAQSGSATVTINPQPNADLNSSAPADVFNGFPVFKICSNQNTLIDFFNASTTTASNISYTINWGDGTSDFTSTNSWTSTSHNYSVGIWTLLYTIKGQNSCNITKTYKVFIGNNPAVGLGNPGNTDICISSSLTFPITGTENNPPGTTYTVTFNDGSAPISLNHPPPASVTHTFLKNSCGTTSTVGPATYQNSFYASIVAINPCDQSSASVVPIRISTSPVANFTLPQTVQCTNTQVCLTNTSIDGDTASSTNCSPPKIIWTISPNSGYTLASGTLGNDFGSASTNSWTSGSSSICPVFTNSGVYSITMKGGNHCGTDQIIKTICIESPLSPQFILNNNSGCTPQAITATNTTVTANSCTSPTYVWNVTHTPAYCGTNTTTIPNQTTTNASFNFVVPGTYTISLTATNSCGAITSAIQTVTVKKPPTAIINPISNACGTATISPTAVIQGCAPASSVLTYAWSFPGGTPATATTAIPGSITYSTVGNYTVSLTVTNECGVSVTDTKTFSVSTTPTLTNTALTQTICSGSQTVLVNLTADTPGTTFSWTGTATAGTTGFTTSGATNTIPIQTITNTSNTFGTVTYIITPTIGTCQGIPVNYVVNVNPAPTNTTPLVSSTVCIGGTPTVLSVLLNNTSGNPTYQWYSNLGNLLSGETSSTFSPPSTTAGSTNYYCEISLTSGGCSSIKTNTATVVITPLLAISTQPIATQNLCVGTTISSPLSVITTGGIGALAYQWYSNTTNSTTGSTPVGTNAATYTPPVFNAVGTFYYYVVVSASGSGCGTATSTFSEVLVVADPSISVQPLPSQTLCQNVAPTNLSVTASGDSSVGALSYQWYSNGTNSNSGGTMLLGETNDTFTPPTNLVGTIYYYCEISQSGLGCNTKSIVATVIINLAPAITLQPTSSTICLGGTPTLLKVAYTNGVGTPQYQWYSYTTNATIGSASISGATNDSFSPPAVSVGTTYYYCIITLSGGGCSVLTSAIAEVKINPNPVIANKNAVICSGTAFTVAPDNLGGDLVQIGTTYTWTAPVISPSNSINGAAAQPIPQTAVSQNLTNTLTSPATVTYTVTPVSGVCVGANFTITVTVNPSINANVTLLNSTCFGSNNGSIQTNISGGIPFSSGQPYLISWTGSGGFTAGATSISNLLPGIYDLTIQDAGGCPFSKSYTVTQPQDILIIKDVEKNITCFGAADGQISISVTGGTGVYSYSWTKDGIPFTALDKLTNLAPGNYQVTVNDTNNCGPKSAFFTITEPPVLDLTLVNQTNVLCFGALTGAINVGVIGGTLSASGYTFAWTGPNSFTSTAQNLNNILAGTYKLTVTDASGCTDALTVVVTQPTEVIVAVTTTPIICYGANNASINLSISGGSGPYQAVWNTLATGTFQDNLSAGNYQITVTEANGCSKIVDVNIPEAPIFTINPVVKQISCFGANNGSINLNLVGGIAPIKLVWNDGSTSGLTRNNLGQGTYTVTITDSKPCVITRTFVIQEPQLLVLGANVTDAFDCTNANSGAINLSVAGGTAPFTYSWTNGASTEDLTNIPGGNYMVTVTDARGCSKTAQYVIIRPKPITIAVTTETVFDCDAKSVSQKFTALASGGVPPFTYNWSSGTISGTNNTVMETNQSGVVVLVVTDALGCKANYSLNVDVPIIGNTSFSTSSFAYSTYGNYSIVDPIQFTNSATGDYSGMVWDFGDGSVSTGENPVHTYVKEGSYVITQTVTYSFGCVYTHIITLLVDKGYQLMSPNGFTPNGDGINDTFRPVFVGLKSIQLDVYDTWGELIYTENGATLKGWDGRVKEKESENGNYYYKVKATTFYGTIINGNGPFTLIK